MTPGWKTVKLREVCEIIKGKKPALSSTPADGYLPYLVAKVIRGLGAPLYASLADRNSVEVSESDIIIICDGSNSGEVFTGFSGILSSTMGKLRIREDVSARYLLAFLDATFDLFNGSKTGSAIPHLDKDKMYELDFSFPDTHEQERIVAILEKNLAEIAHTKANTERQLINTRKILEQEVENSLFDQDWDTKKLGELCDGVEYGSSAKSAETGKVPVLRMGNIQDGAVDWSNLVYTNDEQEINKYLLNYDDVLFNRTNSAELVGKSAVYKSKAPAVFAGYLIRVKRKEASLNADYLNYYLNSSFARNYGRTVMSSSVHQANINGTKLKDYPIPTPPIAEQKRLVERFNELKQETQALSRCYQQKLVALGELKQAVLTRAFSDQI